MNHNCNVKECFSNSTSSFIEMNTVSSDLGDRWSPAVIKSEVQLEFIKTAMDDVAGSWCYLIGGTSTTAEEVTPYSYSASTCTTTSGNIIISVICKSDTVFRTSCHLFHKVTNNNFLENWISQT